MTRKWIKIISNLRKLILCFAVMIYGLPMTAHATTEHTMATPHMMTTDMSDAHCDDGMTEIADDGMSCCDTDDCEYSCTGISIAITIVQMSSLEIPSQTQMDRFINHLTSVDPASDSPPPQA